MVLFGTTNESELVGLIFPKALIVEELKCSICHRLFCLYNGNIFVIT